MFVGQNFPSKFNSDNFNIRRANTSGYGNWYDPESLISGAELARGLNYTNSARNWVGEWHYNLAVEGRLTTEEILATAPREFKSRLDHQQWVGGN